MRAHSGDWIVIIADQVVIVLLHSLSCHISNFKVVKS